MPYKDLEKAKQNRRERYLKRRASGIEQAHQKEYRKKYKERRRELDLLNRERIKDQQREWRKNNPDKTKEYNKRKDPEKVKETNRKASAKARKEKPEIVKGYQIKYRENNAKEIHKQDKARSGRALLPSNRYSYAKSDAKTKRKISFTLTKEEYTSLIQLPCFYCEYKIGTPVKTGIGLDRLDNLRGYEPDNVVSCCRTCNIMRGDHLTSNETKIAILTIISYRKNPWKISTIDLSIYPLTQLSKEKNKNPAKRYSTAKSVAKTRKMSFSISKEKYTELIQQPCYYCQYELGTPVQCSVGLDRLDNCRGYDIDNIVSCCAICNCMRNEFFTPNETRVAVQAILHYRKIKSDFFSDVQL